jgi:hypothetical protein
MTSIDKPGEIPKGWTRTVSGGLEWYYRDVMIGTTTLRVDAWHVDKDQWLFSLQNGRIDTVFQPTAEKAMRAVDVIVAADLRAAAKVIKEGTK